MTTVGLTLGGVVLAFVLIPRIVMARGESGATLAWILAIAFLPYAGALLYFLIGRTRVWRRKRRRKLSRRAFLQVLDGLPRTAAQCDASSSLPELPRPAGEIARMGACAAGSPLLPGNRLEVLTDTNRTYALMEEAIRGARHHVHVQSYIFRGDEAGTRIRDALCAKAREGIAVRLLVDAVGSHGLRSSFVRPLLEAGGKFGRFMPVLPLRPHWRPNLRNHRKIVVVDGRIGFAGGLNIGDEYRGRKKRFKPWRDTHMRLEGNAVLRLQEIFLEDWLFATDEDIVDAAYFPELGPVGDDLVQVIGSGPDEAVGAIHAVFFTAITESRRTLFITTPYLVPDPAMLMALKSAVWRGVDVRILVPGKSDLPLIRLAGRSYYRELLEAGVKLYEHRPGMLHAKTMVVDCAWSTVGSANMDIRSFRLNFEVNVLVSGEGMARQLESIFLADIAKARPVALESVLRRPARARFLEGVARVLSPIL
ncbi:MAG: cardiolipin synthase [Deltaproteobacteria bacterium]|nr:cardiolipin synthase [Deltaproteobacteria bacterium]